MKTGKIFSLILASAVLLISAACNPAQTDDSEAPKKFFDLVTFMDDEANNLEQEKARLSKTVVFNGKEESMEFPAGSTEWERELSAFSESDINKPAWRDSYKTDSVITMNHRIVKYISTDEELPVSLLSVAYNNKNLVDSIYIETKQSNMLYKTLKRLSYVRGKSIWISGFQHTVLLGTEQFEIRSDITSGPD